MWWAGPECVHSPPMSNPPASSLLRNEIANVPVSDLVRDFGTPTYVYDRDRIV